MASWRDHHPAADLFPRVLDQHGISTYRIEHRRRHRAVLVDHARKDITLVIPSSGSDWPGARNAEADLRRALRRTEAS
jgi:hypothetical protein